MTPEEFEQFYRATVRTVFGYARARVGPTDAADVTSEAFHAAALAVNQGRGHVVSEAWVMAVARNKVIDRWRAAQRRNAKAHLVMATQSDLVAFPADWTADDRRDDVLDALDQLSSRHRALLILHHVDGLGIAEIAAEFGMSGSAIESAMARARASFRRNYAGSDIDEVRGHAR